MKKLLVVVFLFLFLASTTYALPVWYSINGYSSINHLKTHSYSGYISIDDNPVLNNPNGYDYKYNVLTFDIRNIELGNSYTGNGGFIKHLSDGPCPFALGSWVSWYERDVVFPTEDWSMLADTIVFQDLASSGYSPVLLERGWVGDGVYDKVWIELTAMRIDPVPEPGTMFLLSLGLIGIIGIRKKILSRLITGV